MVNVRTRQVNLAERLRKVLGGDFVVVPAPDHPLVLRSVDVLVGGRSGLTAFMMASAEENRRPAVLEARLTLNQAALPARTQFVYVSEETEASPIAANRFAEQIGAGTRSMTKDAAAIVESSSKIVRTPDAAKARQLSQSRFAATYRVARMVNANAIERDATQSRPRRGANLTFDLVNSVPSGVANRTISTRTLLGLSVRGAERWFEPTDQYPLPTDAPAGLVFSPGFARPQNDPDKVLRAAAFAGWILAPMSSPRTPEQLAELALRFTR